MAELLKAREAELHNGRPGELWHYGKASRRTQAGKREESRLELLDFLTGCTQTQASGLAGWQQRGRRIRRGPIEQLHLYLRSLTRRSACIPGAVTKAIQLRSRHVLRPSCGSKGPRQS